MFGRIWTGLAGRSFHIIFFLSCLVDWVPYVPFACFPCWLRTPLRKYLFWPKIIVSNCFFSRFKYRDVFSRLIALILIDNESHNPTVITHRKVFLFMDNPYYKKRCKRIVIAVIPNTFRGRRSPWESVSAITLWIPTKKSGFDSITQFWSENRWRNLKRGLYNQFIL